MIVYLCSPAAKRDDLTCRWNGRGGGGSERRLGPDLQDQLLRGDSDALVGAPDEALVRVRRVGEALAEDVRQGTADPGQVDLLLLEPVTITGR